MTLTNHELLLEAYAAYNRRDADALLALVSENVDARLHGKDEVRAYWNHQWAEIHTHDEIVGLTAVSDGTVRVRIHQVVRTLDGSVVSTGRFDHIHQIEDGLIVRMDIRESPN